MESVIITAYKIGLDNLASPKVVHIPGSAIKRIDEVPAGSQGDIYKPGTSKVHVERSDGGMPIVYGVYETRDQIAVAMDPTATNPYAIDKTLGVSAAGTDQGTATALDTYLNEIDTITVDTQDGVKMPAAAANKIAVIINSTAIALQVFPDTGDTIDSGAANAVKAQAAKSRKHYVAVDDTNWVIASE